MRRLIPYAALTLTLIAPKAGFGFTLTPMSVSFETSGKGATQTFQAHNDAEEDIAVEISLSGRVVAQDGSETQPKIADVDKLFLVYPPQVILKAGEKRNIRVSWIGPSQLPEERAYRLIAEQLPVDTKPRDANRGATIKMLLKYVAALYVTPPQAKPKVVLKSFSRQDSATPKLRLVLENQGNRHTLLNGLQVKLTPSTGKPVILPQEALSEVAGQNLLANSSRRFEVPWPTQISAQNAAKTRVEIEIKE